jgi:uncharacterized protein (TIGR03086 family)
VDTDDLTTTQGLLANLLGELSPSDWSCATPCDGWDVATLARHLVVGERAFTTALGGTAYDLVAIDAEVAGVLDLAAAYAESTAALQGLVAAAPAGATYPASFGPRSAEAIAEIRAIEALAHGWDVTVATGRAPLAVDEDLGQRAIGWVVALVAGLPADRTPFAEPVHVDQDRPAYERFLGAVGRDPSATR